MADDRFDVIVAGGGAIGLSAAYCCARAGKKTLLLEQFDFFNERHSSKGDSRFFRIAYSDALLCLLAQSSLPLWRQLERDIGETLIEETGVLFYGMAGIDTREGNLRGCLEVMDALGIPYEHYDAPQLKERFPALKDVPSSAIGIFQADAGFTYAHRTLKGLHRLAQQCGAALHQRESVTGIAPSAAAGSVAVRTDRGTYRADKVILAPGAWANDLLSHLGLRLNLTIWHVTYAYFKADAARYDYPMWFFFGAPDGDDPNLYYGLPPLHPPGQIKAGSDFTEEQYSSPTLCSFKPNPQILEGIGNFLGRTFHGVDPAPLDPQSCIYTMTPDLNFALDFVPGYDNIVLFTGGTGQAFKFAPLIGTILSQLALVGETEYNIKPFAIERPGLLS